MINKIMSGDYSKIYIYGTTELGKNILTNIGKIECDFDVIFIDKNIEKQKNGFYGKKVEDVTNINDTSALYIIAGRFVWESMYKALISAGIPDDRIIFPDEISRLRVGKLNKIIEGRMPQPTSKMAVNVPLVEHCNLNCQMCHHFAPVAEERFANINQFEKDMARLYELLGDDFHHINLTGGEPSLHPELLGFFRITRRYFKKSAVWLLTNGLKLKDFDDEFWKCCNENDITIEVTKYPLDFDYDALQKKAERFGVKYSYYSNEPIKTSIHFCYDVTGQQNPYEQYNLCYFNDGHGRYLKDSKLWHCTVTPNFEHFNKYFGQDIQVSEKDYIDIYSDVTAEEILRFFAEPAPACKYCKIHETTLFNKWAVSKKSITEWT